ncbi:MAG: hypothetical protein AB7I27_19445 [Bacteriovoracaceae bacterium]
MNWLTLEQVWKSAGKKDTVKVRFNDWGHQIKFFSIHGESSDGKRLVGTLNTGEKISYPKRSRGWILYYSEAENTAKAV